MNELLQIFGISLASVFCALALKKYAPETSVLLVITAGAYIFISVLSKISPVMEQINNLGVSGEYTDILIKSLGICMICQFVSDTCRDCGQSSLASKVEFASKTVIIITALPLFGNILNTAMDLMK